jgi:hypothetical protein
MGSIAIYQRASSLAPDGQGRVDTASAPLELRIPGTDKRLARALVADLGLARGSGFLDIAAGLCRECQIWPVVLTVARTESDARFRQAQSQALFAADGVRGDFDYAVSNDLYCAVVCAARWRTCCHIFIERYPPARWWHWLRRDSLSRPGDWTDLTFLTAADAVAATRIRTNDAKE